jgi:hypothetical protein
MARYADYVDSYTPGEVYSAGLDDYQLYPQLRSAYLAKKKFKFQPESEEGAYFQKFLNMQNNPEAVLQESLKLPQGFQSAMALFSGQ